MGKMGRLKAPYRALQGRVKLKLMALSCSMLHAGGDKCRAGPAQSSPQAPVSAAAPIDGGRRPTCNGTIYLHSIHTAAKSCPSTDTRHACEMRPADRYLPQMFLSLYKVG